MSEVTRKTVVRLAVLAALLAAYPLAILVLRAIDPLTTGEELAELKAGLNVAAGPPPCSLGVSLTLENGSGTPFQVSSVGLSVIQGGNEQLTRLETGAPLAARMRTDAEGRTHIGPFCLDLPPSDAERRLLVTTRVSDPDSGLTRSLMREALLDALGARVIDPEGAQPPEFLKSPESPGTGS